MTFHELTRIMLNSMDFFELRRMAARYAVPYQGVRRQKLIRDIERKLAMKANPKGAMSELMVAAPVATAASRSPEGAVSAKPMLTGQKPLSTTRINTFSARNLVSRVVSVK